MLSIGQAGLQAGDLRQGLLAVAARLLHVLGADEACLGAKLRELERLGLAREVVSSDPEADLERPNLDVVPRHLGDERDPRIVDAADH